MGKVAKVKHPPRRNHDIFKLAEVAQLMAIPAPDGQLFTILFVTGLRKAEARRLRRAHIDLDRRRLIVHEGKGGKDRVVAPIPEALQAVADLDIIEGLRPEDYLWCTRPGGGDVISRRWPIGDTTFSRWYQTRLEQAQVRYLNPHTTRHTYHELMRMAKLDLEERQVLMGHVKISTTADIYGHICPLMTWPTSSPISGWSTSTKKMAAHRNCPESFGYNSGFQPISVGIRR